MLAGIFDVPRCDLYRAKEFLSPTTLTLPNVYYSPDFAAQVSRSNFSTPTSYRPVVLVGDANHELPGIWEVSMRGMAARLAHAVQPTLQMFMIDLTTRYRKPDGSWDPTWDPFESAAIPEHMIVYGIAYDEFGVVIYAFFPRYVVDNDTRTLKWGCGCYEVATEFRHHLQLNSMFHRAQLFRALLTVLEEARKASEKFSSPEYQIKCPQELLDLDKEWAQMGIEARDA
ncbi:hypothetical protein A0H81_00051 [Grifola frondosa]|uniref:Uncharacterized protein n=1 Tax=Grifola frondosa TaxID=5627 RepID=A0A1C7MRU8_GRIFR|nr:hypothetical protein A0H81_00051 [Grifola frondosa]